MSLIQCDSQCSYQVDGYCTLEKPDIIRNGDSTKGCPHMLPISETKSGKK